MQGLQIQKMQMDRSRQLKKFEKQMDRQEVEDKVKDYHRDCEQERQKSREKALKLKKMAVDNLELANRFKKASQMEQMRSGRQMVEQFRIVGLEVIL